MNQSTAGRLGVRHLQAVSQADYLSVATLVAFVVFVSLYDYWFAPNFTDVTLVVTGTVMSLIPAGLWLAFFYRRDWMEPEPKHLVVRTAVLGALLASGIGIPMVQGVFDVPNWLYESPVTQIFGGVLVIGVVQEFLKYAAVRFFIYGSDEYDEPVDGIIYATAAGVGYATMLNIHFIVESGGADLGLASLRIVITALAHASFAGIVGYFMGAEKFEEKPLWWMPLGLGLAALCNGFFFYFRGELTQGSADLTGSGGNQWIGLILAVGVTLAITYRVTHAMEANVGGQERVELETAVAGTEVEA